MKRTIIKLIRPALVILLAMIVLCGLVYPGIITAVAQVAFPHQANGSQITVTLNDGSTINYGSALLAQTFTQPKYLIGRPNMTGSSGPSNLSAVSKEQAALVEERVNWLQQLDPENQADIPVDLVTVSGSGVDPNISPEAAEYQVNRIARERNLTPQVVREILQRYTTNRFLGFIGEPAVNVLKVNLALDGLL